MPADSWWSTSMFGCIFNRPWTIMKERRRKNKYTTEQGLIFLGDISGHCYIYVLPLSSSWIWRLFGAISFCRGAALRLYRRTTRKDIWTFVSYKNHLVFQKQCLLIDPYPLKHVCRRSGPKVSRKGGRVLWNRVEAIIEDAKRTPDYFSLHEVNSVPISVVQIVSPTKRNT